MVLVLLGVPAYDSAPSGQLYLALVWFLPALCKDHVLVVKVEGVDVKDKTVWALPGGEMKHILASVHRSSSFSLGDDVDPDPSSKVGPAMVILTFSRHFIAFEDLIPEELIEAEFATVGTQWTEITSISNSIQFFIEQKSFFNQIEVLKAQGIF